MIVLGAIRDRTSDWESSPGNSGDFCAEKGSCQELSAEYAGEGGAAIESEDGQDDLTGNDSVVGVLGAWPLGVNGLNGPRGKGTT